MRDRFELYFSEEEFQDLSLARSSNCDRRCVATLTDFPR